MPDRRKPGSGRRETDEKLSTSDSTETPPQPPTPPKETKPEVEPDRRHFLHKKVGGKKAA